MTFLDTMARANILIKEELGLVVRLFVGNRPLTRTSEKKSVSFVKTKEYPDGLDKVSQL